MGTSRHVSGFKSVMAIPMVSISRSHFNWFCASLLAVVIAPTAHALADDTWTPPRNGWSRYTNERFGASAEVPLHVFRLVEPPPANGDGRAFTSQDGAEL